MLRGVYRLRGGVGDRLLDMLPQLAIVPAWYRALADPAIGDALCLLHTAPARRWTVAELAAKTGMFRAAFAARFTSHVGEPRSPISPLGE
jgi:transcriptional regulator GlxA family with amidase domain